MTLELLDTRTISGKVYQKLHQLSQAQLGDSTRRKDQYNQAVGLYTYLATWGLLRLKAEEFAINKDGWKEVVVAFFALLEEISNTPKLQNKEGLTTLSDPKILPPEVYLGLTGLGLKLSREFAFWAAAIYADDVKEEAQREG